MHAAQWQLVNLDTALTSSPTLGSDRYPPINFLSAFPIPKHNSFLFISRSESLYSLKI